MINQKLYSVTEAAAVLRLGRTRIYELIKSDALDSIVIGRRRLIKVASIDTLIANSRGGAA